MLSFKIISGQLEQGDQDVNEHKVNAVFPRYFKANYRSLRFKSENKIVTLSRIYTKDFSLARNFYERL